MSPLFAHLSETREVFVLRSKAASIDLRAALKRSLEPIVGHLSMRSAFTEWRGCYRRVRHVLLPLHASPKGRVYSCDEWLWDVSYTSFDGQKDESYTSRGRPERRIAIAPSVRQTVALRATFLVSPELWEIHTELMCIKMIVQYIYFCKTKISQIVQIRFAVAFLGEIALTLYRL